MEETAGKDETRQKPIPKTPKAEEYHQKYYLTRSSRTIEHINSQPVTIFVCGPNEESNPLALKKAKTINELRRIGHDANSGEELVSELAELDGDSPRTANVYENIAAAQSELIVVFCASPGSIGETHEFLSVQDIARKTLVFIDKKHRSGYTREGILEMHRRVNGLVEEYQTEDVGSCRLMTKVIEWVRDYQSVKWMARNDLL